MATMLFDRIVPSGNNAYFPFQMSAASLSPTATVFEANDASGVDTALASGVSVDDMGGGLYALKVLAANMTADKLYYAVVTSGNESVRIPMWAFAPSQHIADALTKLDALQADLDNGIDGLGALKALIDTVDSEVGALQSDVTAILADTAELQGDWANGGRLDALLDRTVAASEAAEDLIGLAADTSSADTVFGKMAKLGEDVAVVDSNVDSMKASIEDGTFGLAALKGHIDDVDTAVAALDAKVVVVDGVVDGIAAALADGTTGLAALKSEIDANEAKLDIIDGVVDSILADTALIGSASDTSAEATVFGKIAALSGDLTTAVTDLTTEINANEAKLNTIDGVVDGVAAEIGDVSDVFGGDTPPATVAAALKAIFDAQSAAADVWDDALDGSDPAGSAGKRLYDLSQDLADGGRLDLILDELTTQGDTNETKLDSVIADTEDLQSKIGAPAGASLSADVASVQSKADDIYSRIGAPAGASVSADISAIKAVVDTLQVSVNAHLVPSVPAEIYSASAAIRVKFGLSIHDGETGALEDPDVVGTNGAAQGQALIAVKTVGGGTDPVLYDAASAGNVLGTSDANGLTGYSMMARKGTGRFEAFAEITAYFNKTVEVQFLCFDSDPVATQQTFTSNRFMLVRSPIQGSFGGGAF